MHSFTRKIFQSDYVLWVAVAVGFLIRAWALGSVPSGLNQDEASTAYDAFALLHYGIDRNGFSLPLVLAAWGSSMQALPAYIVMPFMALFGTSNFVVRLPAMLLGTVSIPLLYALMRQVSDRSTARIAAFLLAISPGHIMLSRWAHEATYFPGLFLLGTLLLAMSFTNTYFLYLAAIVFGLSLYTYAPAYLVVPIFVVMIAAYAALYKKWAIKTYFSVGILLCMMALPLGVFVVINAYDLPSVMTPLFSIPNLSSDPRYENVANFPFINPHFFQTSWENLKQGFSMFSSQNDGSIWGAMPGFGIVYLFSFPLVLLGFAEICQQTWKKRVFRPMFILFAWCISAIILTASISINFNRANIAVIPLVFCAAIGLRFFREHAHIFWSIVALYTVSFFSFTHTYFTDYRAMAAPVFFTSLQEALHEAAAVTDGPICVTGKVNMPYIFALFYNRENPYVFHQTVEYHNPGAEFQSVRRFGRYTFGLESCQNKTYGAYVFHGDERSLFSSSDYLLQEWQHYSVAVPR